MPRLCSITIALGTLLLLACQGPDVGQSCTVAASASSSDLQDSPVAADFLEFGNPTCDSLICIKSPTQPAGSKVKNNPYCSKACVSNDDCYQSQTGLVCRPVTVDVNYIASLPPATQQEYLNLLGCANKTLQQCNQASSYCAAPVQ
jgi:hypothetical protein